MSKLNSSLNLSIYQHLYLLYESTNLYFYFNTSNNKKEVSKTKKINGRTYAFNDKGIMISGWDEFESRDAGTTGVVYFSGQDDGHQVKKGWVYTVPSYAIDLKAYNDDEEKYMYFNNSGDIVADQFKKINGKYYAFNASGIMKTGVVIWCDAGRNNGADSKFVGTIDLDWATGEELSKMGRLNLGKDNSGSSKYIYLDTEGYVIRKSTNGDETPGVTENKDKLKLHLFGDDGARKTGMNSVEFSDDTFTLNTVGNSGDKGTGVFSKKYYSLGILLKASPDIRYGIYQTATLSMLNRQDDNWYRDLVAANPLDGSYLVLTTSGSKQKGNKTAKKDADGNYWMISNTDSILKGIYSVGIKEDNSLSNFRTKTVTRRGSFNDGYSYTTSEVARSYPELFVSDYADEPIGVSSWKTNDKGESYISGVAWTCHNISNSSDRYFTLNYQGPCFQSDYADGSNKWIPFGMLDNALKSATFRWTTYDDDASIAYAVKPGNDYFLNCYWDNIR